MTRENAWTKCDKKKINQVMEFCEEYRKFLSECKTERECTDRAVEMAKENGYVDLMDVIAKNKTLKPGDKVYASNMGKAIVLFNIGTKPIEQGMKILGAHIRFMRTRSSFLWTPIITAESRNTSGLRFLLRSTAL